MATEDEGSAGPQVSPVTTEKMVRVDSVEFVNILWGRSCRFVDDLNLQCCRGPDADCRECKRGFCGSHIGPHLRDVHFVNVNPAYAVTRSLPLP